jgi:hypothetical protein
LFVFSEDRRAARFFAFFCGAQTGGGGGARVRRWARDTDLESAYWAVTH